MACPTDINQIAKGLSEGRATALLWLPADGSWSPTRADWRVSGQLMWLSRDDRPLVESKIVGRNGAGNDRRWRLSPLGLQVRTHLKGLPND
jgi:hypothetical protein